MKLLELLPEMQQVECKTHLPMGAGLLSSGLSIPMVCGGNGMCATCHVVVVEGIENLSPVEAREERTLALLTGRCPGSRLSCQARMLGNVKIRMPNVDYISHVEELDAKVGQRAGRDILHARDGRVLVKKGQVITKYVLNQLRKAENSF